MTTVVNISEAKAHLSRLIEEVQAGGQVVIGKAGRPVAVLRAFSDSSERRQLGVWRHSDVWVADDFDAPLSAECEAAR